jgi:hypothetical protein
MTAAALLQELRSLRVLVARNGQKLRLDAPAGALDPKLRELVRECKAELLGLLDEEEPRRGSSRSSPGAQRPNSAASKAWRPAFSGDSRRREPPLTGEERERYTRLAAQRVARADRAEAERLRRDGRKLEAKALERSAAEAEKIAHAGAVEEGKL